eukprot:TRINITY_DN11170_c0_g1_i2.p1 TRINITY_DN11170_c0_g1~~TRINITY_DN11170_c0_g1_i2.p1  ORF type:complete len:166 (+),score=3.10 TRINITY_DN11170_c0_g1_i2:76-573(+)
MHHFLNLNPRQCAIRAALVATGLYQRLHRPIDVVWRLGVGNLALRLNISHFTAFVFQCKLDLLLCNLSTSQRYLSRDPIPRSFALAEHHRGGSNGLTQLNPAPLDEAFLVLLSGVVEGVVDVLVHSTPVVQHMVALHGQQFDSKFFLRQLRDVPDIWLGWVRRIT